jgi:hypothetical protein
MSAKQNNNCGSNYEFSYLHFHNLSSNEVPLIFVQHKNNTYPKTCATLYEIKYPLIKLLSSLFGLPVGFAAIATSVDLMLPENNFSQVTNTKPHSLN